MKIIKRFALLGFVIPFLCFVAVLFIIDLFLWIITGKTKLTENINKWISSIIVYSDEKL
jgi:hypothetical protein